MTLKELDIFFELCDDPHITRVAKRVSLSQSAVSLSLQSLEAELNEKLFDRVGKKLILNERGRVFKTLTCKHYRGLKEGRAFFAKDSLAGVIRISASKTIGNFVIPLKIYDFSLKYGGVNLEKEITNSSNIIKKVKRGEIDVGFIETHCSDDDIIKKRFGGDRLVVVSKDEKLSKREYYIDELFTKKWIFRESGSGTKDIFLSRLGELSKEIESFMTYNDFDELKSILLEKPETLTCVSNYVVKRELEREELFEVKIRGFEFYRDFYIIYNKNKSISKIFEKFIEFFISS